MKGLNFVDAVGKGNVRNIKTAVVKDGDKAKLLIEVDLNAATWETEKKDMVASAGQYGIQVAGCGTDGLWFNLNAGFNLPKAQLKDRQLTVRIAKMQAQLKRNQEAADEGEASE